MDRAVSDHRLRARTSSVTVYVGWESAAQLWVESETERGADIRRYGAPPKDHRRGLGILVFDSVYLNLVFDLVCLNLVFDLVYFEFGF